MAAARHGHIEISKLLMRHGADVRAEAVESVMLYSWKKDALGEAAAVGHPNIVKLLLKKGGNPTIALNEAAAYGHSDIVQMLLKSGAHVNGRSNGDRTAIIEASERGYKDIVSLLLEHGADPNLQDKWGLAALDVATEKKHLNVERLLIAHGARISAKKHKVKRVSGTKHDEVSAKFSITCPKPRYAPCIPMP
jgi:serine/threonine-protein phosphatase 6 regulatory ankyrin repeat subunit B